MRKVDKMPEDKMPRAKNPPMRARPKETQLLQARVPADLLEAARQEMAVNRVTMREVTTWALSEYLREMNPRRLKALDRGRAG